MRVIAALVLTGAVPAEAEAHQSFAAPSLVFDRVTVIDVEHGQLLPDQRVVIMGNRIQAVGGRLKVALPKGAQVIHAGGKYMIPGLWDMHTHSQRSIDSDVFYPLFLANGVTGIRDAGSEVPLDTLVGWRREILAGTRVGPPRQLLSGQAIDEAGMGGWGERCVRPTPTLHTCVADSADAHDLVVTFKAAGADMLKTYGLSRRMYFVVAAEARRQGIPFGGHAGLVTAREASDSGATILDHAEMAGDLDARCLWKADPHIPSFADMFGFRAPRAFGASAERCQAVADRFVRNGTWWVPTMVAYEGLGGVRATRVFASLKHQAKMFWEDAVFDPYSFLQSDTVGYPVPPATDSGGLLHVAQEVGLPILAGTDLFGWSRGAILPGFALHAELAMYVAEGLTPLNALRSATLNPAKMWHATDSLGTVGPGKLADLVLLDANPLTNIANTTTIRAVVANGRYFDRATLDSLLNTARTSAKHVP